MVRAELAVLQEQRVNATFFPIGTSVAADPGLWRSIAAARFPIGNHTYDHANLTRLTFDQALTEMRRANDTVRSATGAAPAPFLRPPGGSWNQTTLSAARAAGERAVVTWDTTFGDTGRGPVSQLVINAERGTNGSIILMHANEDRSVQALPEVIAFYRAAGFRFVTLGQLFGVPGPVPYPND